MIEKIKLKPCPFCGGKATLKYVDDKTWQVVCADCGACSDYYCEEFDINNPPEGNEAVKAWNDRKSLDEFLPSNSIEFMVKFYKELGKILIENKKMKTALKIYEDAMWEGLAATGMQDSCWEIIEKAKERVEKLLKDKKCR